MSRIVRIVLSKSRPDDRAYLMTERHVSRDYTEDGQFQVLSIDRLVESSPHGGRTPHGNTQSREQFMNGLRALAVALDVPIHHAGNSTALFSPRDEVNPVQSREEVIS